MQILIRKMDPNPFTLEGKFSLAKFIKEAEPVFVATRCDQVLLFTGLCWAGDWEYCYDVPHEHRAHLEADVEMHIELMTEFQQGLVVEPEDLLKNRGAIRL